MAVRAPCNNMAEDEAPQPHPAATQRANHLMASAQFSKCEELAIRSHVCVAKDHESYRIP